MAAMSAAVVDEVGGNRGVIVLLAEDHGDDRPDVVLVQELFLDELVHDVREVLLRGDAVDDGYDGLDMANGGVEALPLGKALELADEAFHGFELLLRTRGRPTVKR